MFDTLKIFAQAACKPGGGGVFGFPTWYKYLPGVTSTFQPEGATDAIVRCTPKVAGINDIWLIGAAVLEMLLRIAALAAIVMIIYGGYKYMTSQAEPDRLKGARDTLINAVIGLVIVIAAISIVNYVAGKLL